MRKILAAAAAIACAALLASCSLVSGVTGTLVDSDFQKADAQMQRIGDAINSHDAAALKTLFSPRALEQASDIDRGLDYFLSFFPNGGVTWQRDAIGSEADLDNGQASELLHANYDVFADGKEYFVSFADFTVNDAVDPQNAGIYGLGVTPYATDLQSGPAKPFFQWANNIHIDNNGEYGYAGVYVPTGAAEGQTDAPSAP